MSKEIEEITDKNIKTLLHTAIEMQSNYDFYIPPLFDGIDALQKDYEEKVKQTASQSREYYQSLLASKDKETAFEETKKGNL
ncbi:MAG: hypothetical protein ACOX47_08915 [Bacillota bacterium]